MNILHYMTISISDYIIYFIYRITIYQYISENL